MRAFLIKCTEGDIFFDFFAHKDEDLAITVDGLFEEYFTEAFSQSENPGFVDKMKLTAVINEKFSGDDHLQEVLLSELEKVESPEAGENQIISVQVVKKALRTIV